MTNLLNDDSTYKKNKDPLKKLSRNVNSLVRNWHNSNLIEETTYKQLVCNNGNLPRCYGLPKIHKAGYPL